MNGLKEVKGEKGAPCVSLIGMPGSGKSTIGALLAERLNWAFMDTDFLLESLYAARLQDVVDRMGKKAFLDAEATMIRSIKAQRCVIATGGSVIYRPEAMRHLQSLGPVIYLEADLAILLERIAENPERGIAIEVGQTLEELYRERAALYNAWADIKCGTTERTVDDCVDIIINKINAGLFTTIKGRLTENFGQHD